MPEETLLPLHREFTDKEKYEWMKKNFNELEAKHKALVAHNNKMVLQNIILKEEIKMHEAEIPSTLNGSTTVTAKTFLKLHKRYKEMIENFWRVNDELLALQKKIQSEKL